MSLKFRNRDFKGLELPEELHDRYADLSRIGFTGIGWDFEGALEFINFLNLSSFVVLGGETYRVQNGKYIFSWKYDWAFTNEELLIDEGFMERNKRQAIDKITNFENEAKANGEKLVYRISSGSLEWLKSFE